MNRRRKYVVLAAPLCLSTLAACGAAVSPPTPRTSPLPTALATASATASGPATVTTGMTSLGTVLTDGQGHTLYYLSTEQNGQDDCTMQPGCLLMWPTLAPPSDGVAVPGSGVSGALSVLRTADGSLEVTYNGWPLHTFSGETAGQVTGQDEASFGGTWEAATPEMVPTSNDGAASGISGLETPPSVNVAPGALPTSPFAPTTPAGTPTQPALPTIPAVFPTDPS